MVPPRWNCRGGKVWPLTRRVAPLHATDPAPALVTAPSQVPAPLPGAQPAPDTPGDTPRARLSTRCLLRAAQEPQTRGQRQLQESGAAHPGPDLAAGRARLNPEHRKAPGQRQEGWKPGVQLALPCLPRPGVRGKLRQRHEETRRGLLLVCQEVSPPSVRQRVLAVSWSAAKPPKNGAVPWGLEENPRKRRPGRRGTTVSAQFLPGFCPAPLSVPPRRRARSKHRRARPPPQPRSAFPSREREAALCLA